MANTPRPFDGPLTNDSTALFLKATAGVTATANLVASIKGANDSDGKWSAVKTWAGADVLRLPSAIAELPGFVAPPNRINVETYDGDGQTVQVLGIGQTPDLELTIALYDPSNATHQTIAGWSDNTRVDILLITASNWPTAKDATPLVDGDNSLRATGEAIHCVASRPHRPGGAANDTVKLVVPLAFKSRSYELHASS